jgi:nucleotide-binding universal stress UspA family protein
MTILLIALIVLLVLALVALGARHARIARRQPARPPAGTTRRILFPFVASALSARALDAALRLARAEEATLMPVFLATVPLNLPLDAPLPRQAGIAIPLQEAIEQRAMVFGIPVDARIERGRSHRHALRRTFANERFERIVIAAATHGNPGFHPDDVAWLLDNARGEIVVLRPAKEELLEASAKPTARRPATDQAPAGGRDHAALIA